MSVVRTMLDVAGLDVRAIESSSGWTDSLLAIGSSTIEAANAVLVQGLQQEPVVTIAIAIAVAVPALALVGLLVPRGGRRPRAYTPPAEDSVSDWSPMRESAGVYVGGQRWPLECRSGRPFRIGTADDCDIRLRHPAIAAYHVIITRRADGQYEACDLEQREACPLLVEGQRSLKRVLAGGEAMELAGVTLRFDIQRQRLDELPRQSSRVRAPVSGRPIRRLQREVDHVGAAGP